MNNSQRHFSNIKLTSRFHFRYMGLWVVITSGFTLVTGLLLFLLAEEHWRNLYAMDTPYQEAYAAQRQLMGWALGIAVLMACSALILLAKTTAHRIAGPYIKLQRVFESVRQGHFDQELRFRKYDHLEDLEKEFNAMMAAIRERIQGAPPP